MLSRILMIVGIAWILSYAMGFAACEKNCRNLPGIGMGNVDWPVREYQPYLVSEGFFATSYDGKSKVCEEYLMVYRDCDKISKSCDDNQYPNAEAVSAAGATCTSWSSGGTDINCCDGSPKGGG